MIPTNNGLTVTILNKADGKGQAEKNGSVMNGYLYYKTKGMGLVLLAY